MKFIFFSIFFLFFFNININRATNVDSLPRFLFASDIDCLINLEYKLSLKEQRKIRHTLVDLAEDYKNEEEIYKAFITIFPKMIINSSIEKDCIVDKLYSDKKTLTNIINSPMGLLDKSQIRLTEQQKQSLITLFQLRTLFAIKYAYFDNKKNIFNREWKIAVESCIFSFTTFNEFKVVKKILSALDDPHVGCVLRLVGDNKNDMPCILKNDSLFVLPFKFNVSNNKVFIKKLKDTNHKLTNDSKLLEEGMEILEINGLTIQNWIDSVDIAYGPLKDDRNILISNFLQLYYFCEGKTVFKLTNANNDKQQLIEINRIPLSKYDYDAIFRYNDGKDYWNKDKFHYVQYYKQTNKSLAKILNSLNINDTIVLDFRGYPSNDIYSSTQLLFSEEEKKVAYSLMRNTKTGCFDIKEDESYYPKDRVKERDNIRNKKLTIMGIIDGSTGSLVETVVMSCKAYLKNFMLLGQPTAGAFGTIDFGKVGTNIEVTYPYHKFYFYNKNQFNASNKIIPDLYMDNKEINTFINYGKFKRD